MKSDVTSKVKLEYLHMYKVQYIYLYRWFVYYTKKTSD